MALVTCHYFSEALGVSTAMTVLLPQATQSQIGLAGVASAAPPPVLYLLHGLSDDETIWTRRTSIERYAAERGVAVVMPRAGRSFYSDEVHGGAHWTHLTQELPALVSSFFRVSDRREDTFVAGLSMGGYGAVKWALREPTRFAAAASLSGALDIRAEAQLVHDVPQVWGPAGPGPDDDLLALLDAAEPAALPALMVTCGTQDFLHRHNLSFLDRARERGIDVLADVEGPGDHEWGYWDARIQDVLAWLPLGR
ncbi:esterase family protein [Cellulomonas sp. DKR-3]|uniref:Esterase family protein n=1 Tax=Cellulomonas fulva TaxID=2835530 RepID=A0ABS5U2I6_9CELL|nr:alpha/beta hydrolase family protein [Cellulomonas fulva]MBT0995577.1 esterase family protein [Cellulomonas fulva]